MLLADLLGQAVEDEGVFQGIHSFYPLLWRPLHHALDQVHKLEHLALEPGLDGHVGTAFLVPFELL